ncbi:MAG: YbaB/EbfC family nucleoid-associated protein [Acidimicrobiia bacterium]
MADTPAEQPDLSALFEQAQQLQASLLGGGAGQTFEGVAGGGAVKVTVTAAGEFQQVTIRPDAVDPDDVAMLEDLVLAAVRDASAQASAAAQQGLGAMLGGLLGGDQG